MAAPGPKAMIGAKYAAQQSKIWLYSQATRSLQAVWGNARISRLVKSYEDWIGITDIKATQAQVIELEYEFVSASNKRRNAHQKLADLQNQLKEIRLKLDGTHRGDVRYLSLVTQEHELIKTEIQTGAQLRSTEEIERELFSRFSNKLRDAHEVERNRQEKTKYFSYVLSLAGVILGIMASSINHYLHDRDINRLVGLVRESSQRAATSQPLVGMNEVDTSSRNTHATGVQQQILDNHSNSKNSKSQLVSSSASESVSSSMNFPLKEHANSAATSDNHLSQNSALSSVSNNSANRNQSQSVHRQSSGQSSPAAFQIDSIVNPLNAAIVSSESNLEQKIKLAALSNVVATYAIILIAVAIVISRNG